MVLLLIHGTMAISGTELLEVPTKKKAYKYGLQFNIPRFFFGLKYGTVQYLHQLEAHLLRLDDLVKIGGQVPAKNREPGNPTSDGNTRKSWQLCVCVYVYEYQYEYEYVPSGNLT
jgi:hypothetical protein